MPKNRDFSKRVEKVSGSVYAVLYSAATSGNLAISPSNASFGTHINSIADAFNLCRCTDLKVTFNPSSTAGDVAVGIATGVIDTIPTAIGNVGQLQQAAVNFADTTVPSRVHAPKSYLLKNQVPWYKTQAGAAADQFETQGYIIGAGTSTGSVNIFIEYTWEFTDWSATASTPKASSAKAALAASKLAPKAVTPSGQTCSVNKQVLSRFANLLEDMTLGDVDALASALKSVRPVSSLDSVVQE